ncbi:MAG: hypothetical protein ACOYL8_03735 [Patescibacteria group bacterium]
MNKNLKYLIAVLLTILLFVISYLFFFQKSEVVNDLKEENNKNSSLVIEVQKKPEVSTERQFEVKNKRAMTEPEKTQLRVDPALKIEVLQVNASGTPTAYRIIK